MSYVVAAPEFVVAAAHDLATIGSNLGMANIAAVFPTSGVIPAGADEVSATIAALFGAHAQAYQALSAQAALFHQQFVQLMSGGAGEYALTEAANASPLNAVQQGTLSAAPAASAVPGATTVPAAPPPAAAVMTGVPPAAGTPVTLAALTAPSAPAAVVQAAPSPAGAVPMAMASGTPVGATAAPVAEPAAAPVQAVQAETAEFAPSPASPLSVPAGTPVAAAPASRAYTPATPAYSPVSAQAAEEQPAD
jgi:hypothetical protein